MIAPADDITLVEGASATIAVRPDRRGEDGDKERRDHGMEWLIGWFVWTVIAGVTAPIWLPIADVVIGCVVNIIDPRRWQ